MRRALVFSGQGSHRKGMCMNTLTTPSVNSLWARMNGCMMQNYGVSLQEIIAENPKQAYVRGDAFDTDAICSISCKEVLNTSESTKRDKIVRHPDGVMSYSYFTQPCVLAAQLLALEKLKTMNDTLRLQDFHLIAGHSLGEFSALCALGVFSPECALNLTYKRGLLMEQSLDGEDRTRYRMYACNPGRAKLHENNETADDIFFVLVELIAQALKSTTSFVEVANYNLQYEQYVVAGDVVALSVLGKCLDPQFRANCASSSLDGLVLEACRAVKLDESNGVTFNPNKGLAPDFVTSAAKKYGSRSVFRRFVRGPDDGFTPSLQELSHLTLQDEGRSGLKKKSWYVPLSVEVPFHTSRLRRSMDKFLPVVHSALPDEATLRRLLSIEDDGSDASDSSFPLWVTNLTGRTFRPFNLEFQNACITMISSQNVGEIQHNGRYSSSLVLDTFNEGVAQKSVVNICAAVLAAQLAHPVLWIDAMDEIVLNGGCGDILEIAPVRNVSGIFSRAHFAAPGENSQPVSVTAKCFPADGAKC